jgi:hypothetical protein
MTMIKTWRKTLAVPASTAGEYWAKVWAILVVPRWIQGTKSKSRPEAYSSLAIQKAAFCCKAWKNPETVLWDISILLEATKEVS